MLFNSYEFIFLYLPVVISVYFFLGNYCKKSLSTTWLLIASLYFYAHWNNKYLLLLMGSILINYFISGKIIEYRKKIFFLLGIFFNVGLLCYFKYMDFFIINIDKLGIQMPLLHIVLPLGISFFTITQMVYLVDCYEGVTKEHNIINYALFVSFFPHLLAGPILYHRPMMKQFNDKNIRCFNWDNMAHGISLFIIGLAKKVLIADSFVTFIGTGFNHPESLTIVHAWLTAIAYMLQIYFDFSGYSDMAVGIARMMNINIPINFNSPYRAYGIINFWSRWHISLTITITNYIYMPIVKSLKKITFFKAMIASFLTMFIAGIWHGAGWTYIIFGILHGIGIVINHIWKKYHMWMWVPLGYLLTFLLVLTAFVFFRADNTHIAIYMLKAMIGEYGSIISPVSELNNTIIIQTFGLPLEKFLLAILIVIFFPSSNELIKKINISPFWLLGLTILFIFSIFSLYNMTEFLYFQF